MIRSVFLLLIVLVGCVCARFSFSNSWKIFKSAHPSDSADSTNEGNTILSSYIVIPAFSKAQQVISILASDNFTENVRFLALNPQSFTTEEFYKICNRISKCKQLQGIVLDGCKLTQEDARSLTQSLRKLTSLRYLSLSHCGLEDEHMTSLCLLARSPGSITHWDLSDNHLTSESFDSLYRVLVSSANNTLELLDLSYNKLGGVLVTLLDESGRKNKLKYLKYLTIKQVGLSGRTSLKLLDILNTSASLLQHLDLSGNTLISESSSMNKQPSMKALLSEYTKANGKLLTDALTSLTSSLSTSGTASTRTNGGRSKPAVRMSANRKKKSTDKSPSSAKPNMSGVRKAKKATIAVVEKTPTAAPSTRQLIASRLLQVAQQKKIKYLGLCKTGLDSKFGQVLAQAADKVPTSSASSGDQSAECVVDVRLNDINSKEVEAIVKRFS